MKRGDIWTVAGAKDYLGKPRPAVIIQNDRFSTTKSITVCAFTSAPVDAYLTRLLIHPSATNGLSTTSRLMVDKIETVPKSKIGKRVGRLEESDMARLDRAILIFLDLDAAAVGSGSSIP